MEIKVLKNIFDSNEQRAADIKKLLAEKKIFMANFLSSPGSGKTTIADRIISGLKQKYGIAVIEGDIATTNDAKKLQKHDIPIIQIETALFQRDCHLESMWIRKCLDDFDLDKTDFVIIENIGNLVCPAEFDLGEDERVVVLSVTEGEDKPVKYPMMFNSSQAALVNKVDLLPHLDYNLEEALDNIRKVNPKMRIFQVSAKTGEGFGEFLEYLDKRIAQKKSS